MKDTEVGSIASERKGSGPKSWAESYWHVENATEYPQLNRVFEDVNNCIKEYVVTGHTPTKPLLNNNSNVVTIGSCFAAELRHFLTSAGLSSNSFWIPSGLNNTFALRDFLNWVITGEETSKGYRYERNLDGVVSDWTPEYERGFYLSQFKSASAFVFTLGLAEIWEDSLTNKVFWRGIPESVFEKGRHNFRLSSVSENTENINAIIKLLQLVNKDAPVILTLSPVPLKASFQGQSCVTADCVSKSTLRVALHEALATAPDNTFYWPSFEIVKWLGCHLPYPVYGTDDSVVRHVSRYMVLQILKAFTETYYGKEISAKVFSDFSSTLEEFEGKEGEPPMIYKGTVTSG
ncbi:GSCFA domain-containing protein [Agarivorans sp. MS3-6]|uniref:GSCFA domain-containing protein n=1 Tax=Agarivorans sp. TSD2052 TaxID=2937286 RepID=UPI00200E0DFF|nr:GSCFA domain-containing protein [Agarivorans sp. TSD2052]UPW20067.1 GSCFA domain-containing protein [Agarivorans sp. TSD2052]